MKCWKCGNELTTGDAPNSAQCRRCEQESISSSPASAGSARYPVFTIPQIRQYLTGGIFTRGDDPGGAHLPENTALRVLIAELEDHEDGIEAVTSRTEWQEPNKTESI